MREWDKNKKENKLIIRWTMNLDMLLLQRPRTRSEADRLWRLWRTRRTNKKSFVDGWNSCTFFQLRSLIPSPSLSLSYIKFMISIITPSYVLVSIHPYRTFPVINFSLKYRWQRAKLNSPHFLLHPSSSDMCLSWNEHCIQMMLVGVGQSQGRRGYCTMT